MNHFERKFDWRSDLVETHDDELNNINDNSFSFTTFHYSEFMCIVHSSASLLT